MPIKNFIRSYLWIPFIFLFTWNLQAQETLLVTVAPHKFFVEKIVGNTSQVLLMVPAAASAHTYEPTPKQMLNASTAAIWFRIGEPFEERIIQVLKSHNSKLKIVDLRQGLDLIGPSFHSCRCHAQSMDLHFWLSARMAQIQAKTIADALISAFPERTSLYKANLEKFLLELQNLDQEIQRILMAPHNPNILVSHPAYAYFCRDYDLKQYSVECEGKDPAPQQLMKIVNLARNLKIKTIFIQMQYSNKGARLIAEEIGAKVLTLDPYSEHYIESMLSIARAFAEG